MSSPLSLRLCCTAVMAPALTEAASQAKIQLAHSTSNVLTLSVSGSNNERISTNSKLMKVTHPLNSKPFASSTFSNETYPLDRFVLRRSEATQTHQDRFKPLLSLCGLNGKQSFQGQFMKSIDVKDFRCNGRSVNIHSQINTTTYNTMKCKSENNRQPGACRHMEQFATDRSENAECIKKGACRVEDTGQGFTDLSILTSCANSESLVSPANFVASTHTIEGTKISCGNSSNVECVEKAFSDTHSTPGFVASFDVDERLLSTCAHVLKRQNELRSKLELMVKRTQRLQSHLLSGHIRDQLLSYVNVRRKSGTVTSSSVPNCHSPAFSHCRSSNFLHAFEEIEQNAQRCNHDANTGTHVKSSIPEAAENKFGDPVARKLQFNLQNLQSAFDSDVTESSSTDDSEDDDISDGKSILLPDVPLAQRAEWRWWKQRAWIASRWVYLQERISQLEHQICQQTLLHKQLRNAKDFVTLGQPTLHCRSLPPVSKNALGVVDGNVGCSVPLANVSVPSSPCNVDTLLSNLDKQAYRLSQSLGNCLSPTASSSSTGGLCRRSSTSSPIAIFNGHTGSPMSIADDHDSLPSSLIESCSPEVTPGRTSQCARCLPLTTPFHKRRLVRVSEVQDRLRKAANFSPAVCHCVPHLTHCVLCRGRGSGVEDVDWHTMPLSGRVALLDHSYHRVLSSWDEVPLSVHMESLLRFGGQLEDSMSGACSLPYHASRQKNPASSRHDGRKQLSNKASTIIRSAKICGKYDQTTTKKVGPRRGRGRGRGPSNRRGYLGVNSFSNDSHLTGARLGVDAASYGEYTSDRPPSPVTLAASCDGVHFAQKDWEVRRKRAECAFDVVMPHSVTVTNHVRKLAYKEIPTPCWRQLSESELGLAGREDHTYNGDIRASFTALHHGQVEDLSDAAFTARHNLCEEEERRRFASYTRHPHRRTRLYHSGCVPSDRADVDRSVQPFRIALAPEGLQSPVESVEHAFDEESCSSSQCNTPSSPSFSVVWNADDDASWRGPVPSQPVNLLPTDFPAGDMSLHRPNLPCRRLVSAKPWPTRRFPLSDEETCGMSAEDETNGPPSQANPDPRRLRVRESRSAGNGFDQSDFSGGVGAPHLLDGLPISPLPSNSSASQIGDVDTADPEWTDGAELGTSTAGFWPVKR